MTTMPPAAADEFAVRYYRWALADARREVEENFPLLRAVKAALPMRAVAYLESLAGDERLRAATALVKRNHRRAVALTGDVWGADEERIDREYRDAARVWRPEESWYREAMLHDAGRLKIDRARFLAAVKAALAPVLGAGEPFSTKHEWRYDTPLGPWTLLTLVDAGGSVHQLAYTQTLRVSPSRVLKEGLSILGWLGIGGGHTTWDRLSEADTAAAAESIARIGAHFLRALPALVAGLSPEPA